MKRSSSEKRSSGRKAPRRAASRIRLMLVDDHPMWRRTVRNVVEENDVGKIVAEASTASEAVVAASKAQPQVILMDAALPDGTGADVTRELKTRLPETKILFLSASDARSDVASAIASGAHGYLLKTAEPDEVADAILRVHKGELVFPSQLTETVLAELTAAKREVIPSRRNRSRSLDLTDRERGVLELMAEGRSNQAIAKTLHLTPKTVEAHVRSVFTKLQLEPDPDDHRRVLAVVAYLRLLESEG